MKTNAQTLLKENLSERVASNPAYSLRAFARDLGVSPQQLSNVMNGRKGLSEKMAAQLCAKLGITGREKELFQESVRAQFSRSKAGRVAAKAKLEHMSSVGGTTAHLEMDLFKTISHWYHFALIELIKLDGTQKPAFYAKRLGIPENEVKLTFSRLERLELVSREGTRWMVNQDTVIADQGIPNEAVRNFHRQVMEKGMKALAFQTGDERYGSSSMIPIKVKSVKRAKELIQDFRMKFTDELSDQKQGEEIYGLSVQFFRMSEKGNEN